MASFIHYRFRLRPHLIALSLFGGLLLPLGLRAEFNGDFRLWQTASIRLHEDADWRLTAAAETRLFEEGNYLGAWLLFPTLQYKVHPNLDLGATYLFEDIRSQCGTDYERLHIFWLHASPHWQLNDDLNLSMRHVLGYRSVESRDDYWMSRHLFALNYRLKNTGRLVGLCASTELFYRYDQDLLFENRFVPIKGTFKINDRTKLALYLMAQSKRSSHCDDWKTAYIFGQSISYDW
jgi:hypothetical protein